MLTQYVDQVIDETPTLQEQGKQHVYIHQVGPDQEGFFHFYQREVLPRFC